jgi:hypothetical protein
MRGEASGRVPELMWKWLLGIQTRASKKSGSKSALNPLDGVRILKHAQAMRVVFFYPGEEGTYVDDCMVTLFENGVVHLRSKTEETTTHLHHCEILWRYENPVDKPAKGEGSGKVRVLKFKNRDGGNRDDDSDRKPEPPSSGRKPDPGTDPKKPTPPAPPSN